MRMKKQLVLAGGLVMLALAGCQNQSSESVQTTVQEETGADETQAGAETDVETGGETGDGEQTGAVDGIGESLAVGTLLSEGDQAKMLPMMDSILMCYAERGMSYTQTSEEYFWTLMFYYLGNYERDNPLCRISEDGSRLVVPFSVALTDADSLFSEFESLPMEYLERVSDGPIVYDGEQDAFLVLLGDRGLSSSEIMQAQEYDGSVFRVSARLYDDETGESIAVGSFNLIPVNLEDENGEGFPCRIEGADMREGMS